MAVKLICDWCGDNVKLVLSRNSGVMIRIELDTLKFLSDTNTWHTEDTVYIKDQLGGDLCPECKKTAQDAKKAAEDKGNQIIRDAKSKAEEEKKMLKVQALEEAKRKRVPRLERDVTMREKERQRISDGL